jgi:hypothetical protein
MPTLQPPVADTPAVRFFDRGQHLMRLQDRVLRDILAEIEKEHAEFQAHQVTDGPSAMKAAAMAMSVVASGSDRLSDVQLMLQLFFCRHVDNFQIFLESILQAIYVAQPGLLKRSDPVPLTQVLRYSTMPEFVTALIDERVFKLGYKGFGELSEIVKKDFCFELVTDKRAAESVDLAFDVRNLVTHNYGVVNKIFLSKHPDVGLTLGQIYPVSPQRIADDVKLLIQTTADIEKRATAKFKLVFAPPN